MEIGNEPKRSSRWVGIIDTVLLLFCCVLVAARCQINEALPTGWRLTGPIEEVDLAQAM